LLWDRNEEEEDLSLRREGKGNKILTNVSRDGNVSKNGKLEE
jgi:hypothetical protein